MSEARNHEAEVEAVAYVLHEAPPEADLANVAKAVIEALDALRRSPQGECPCIYSEHCDERAGCRLKAGATINEGGGISLRCPQGEDAVRFLRASGWDRAADDLEAYLKGEMT